MAMRAHRHDDEGKQVRPAGKQKGKEAFSIARAIKPPHDEWLITGTQQAVFAAPAR
jgi:hypothetical protein